MIRRSFVMVGNLGRLTNSDAQAEELRVRHEDGGCPVSQAGEGGRQRRAGRGPDADLRLSAEVGHRQPSAVELPEANLHVQSELAGGEAGVDAHKAGRLVHARQRRIRS